MKSIIFSLVFAGASLVSLANGTHGPSGDKTESTAEVKYIGSSEGGIFNVLYTNGTGSRFSVAILDENGNQLFLHCYSDKQFDKKFRLAEPEVFGKLVFVIRNFGDNTVQRFEVNSASRLIEDVEVKEVH